MDDRTLSRGSAGKPRILREYEFYGGCIRVKISVRNTSSLAILDTELELKSDERILHFDRCEPEEYQEKKGKIILGNINPHNDRTIAFYLDPLICAKEGTDIDCRVNFKYADGTLDTAYMEKLKIQVVCPIFRTEHDINIGGLKELIKKLQSHDSKVYTIPKRIDMTESLKTCRNVIQQHDVRHIKTFKTTDDKTYECWYYGKTKITKEDIVIKCAINKDIESIEIFASGNDPRDITGLLAEIGRHLTKEFDKLGKVQPVFNVVVKNSMLKGSNLLSFCDLNGICGGNVVIEDSFVDDTNVASWIQEDKEKTRIEERKKLEEARKQEKQRDADLLRKAQDVQREKERQIRQREEAARIAGERELAAHKEPERTSYKKFFAVALVLGVVWLGYWALAPGAGNAPEALKSIPPAPVVPADLGSQIAAYSSDSKVGDRVYVEGIVLSKQMTKTGDNLILSLSNINIKVFVSRDSGAKEVSASVSTGDRIKIIGRVSKLSEQLQPVIEVERVKDVIKNPSVEYFQKIVTNSIGMEFVSIPAGEFDMGSPSNEKDRNSDEDPVHRVKISNAFYMGKYEVTQKQWRDVMGDDPSYFKGDKLPVEQVSWNDVQEFIKKLNEKEGTNKYRLPSEAEWEYSARAGMTTRYSFGDDESKLGDYAWYNKNSGSKTHEVGQKKPNPWGLYDVHGNVMEWVQDIYHGNYSGAPTDGSAWEGSGSNRVLRGSDSDWLTVTICASGSRSRSAELCLPSDRSGSDPGSRSVSLGFRLLRVP